MKITFTHEARQEFAEAARWYASEAGTARATDFRNAVHRMLALAIEHPLVGTPGIDNTRRIVVHHYPNFVIYRFAGDTLRVLAIAHHSRQPGYWAGRR